jgi:hypothetical protein
VSLPGSILPRRAIPLSAINKIELIDIPELEEIGNGSINWIIYAKKTRNLPIITIASSFPNAEVRIVALSDSRFVRLDLFDCSPALQLGYPDPALRGGLSCCKGEYSTIQADPS